MGLSIPVNGAEFDEVVRCVDIEADAGALDFFDGRSRGFGESGMTGGTRGSKCRRL